MGTSLIRIFQDDKQIGEYERLLPGGGVETFEPFEKGGRWYALYSADYTCTRVMSLPDCRDLGGEEPSSEGFCPVELWVPRYREVSTIDHDSGSETTSWSIEAEAEGFGEVYAGNKRFESRAGSWRSLDTAFVAGCVWGDDSYWKLEVFDLSEADQGKILRHDRFGYLPLGATPLVEAVSLIKWADQPLQARIIEVRGWNVADGALVDPLEW
jgi:hypothetical protein